MRAAPWAALAAGMIVTTVAPGAGARLLLHHDLTSLALLSDAIVLAERGATHARPDGLALTDMRVQRVYTGLVADGSTLEIEDGSYALDGTPEAPLTGRGREVVLFLVRSGRAVPRWWIVASGVRVQVGGRLFRFEQWSNPGPYTPVPQGRDPLDVREGRGREVPVDLATFEVDLRAALARADRVRAALAASPGPPRREPRLALLPPLQDRATGPGRGLGFYRDEVAHRVVASFVTADDLDGALEALARVVGDRPRLRGRTITSETLARIATDASAPPHRRIEALGSVWDPAPPAAAVVDRVTTLLHDPLPDVRAAATRAIAAAARDAPSGAVREAARRSLLAAAARERDPLVRIACLQAAHELDMVRQVRGPARSVVARRRGEEISVAAAWRASEPVSVQLEGVRAGGTPCEPSDRSDWSGGPSAGLVARIRCQDRDAPWSVTVSVRSGRAEARQTLEVPAE